MTNNGEGDSKTVVKDFMLQFLIKHEMYLWYSSNDSPQYMDDLHKYASDISSSTLLLLIFIHAIKYGDTTCIRACHKVFSVFFFSSDGNASKYAPSIMYQLLDYDAASSKERNLIDMFSSINCYGTEGSGVSADLVCEWGVKEIKKTEIKLASNIEVTLLERATKSSNVISSVKDNFLDSILSSNLKSSAGHSSRIIKEEDLQDIRFSHMISIVQDISNINSSSVSVCGIYVCSFLLWPILGNFQPILIFFKISVLEKL